MKHNSLILLFLSVLFTFIVINAFPDPSPDEYLKVEISYDNTSQYFNHQYVTPRIINISGYRVIFEKNHPNQLYDFSGKTDILEMNIQADTLVIRDPLWFPQTKVTIHSRELKFEDKPTTHSQYSGPASINTKPVDITEKPESGINGNHGLKAGDIFILLDCPVSSNILNLRFLLNGGNGQPAGLGEDGEDQVDIYKSYSRIDSDCYHWSCHLPFSESSGKNSNTFICDVPSSYISGKKIVFNSPLLAPALKVMESIEKNRNDPGLSSFLDALSPGRPGEGGDGAYLFSNVELPQEIFTFNGGFPGEPGFDNDDSPNVYEGGDYIHRREYYWVDCNVVTILSRYLIICFMDYGISYIDDQILYSGADAVVSFPSMPSGTEGLYWLDGISVSWLHPEILWRTLEYAYDLPPGDEQIRLKLQLEYELENLEIYRESEQWNQLPVDIQTGFTEVENQIAIFLSELNHPTALLADITQYGDVWGAANQGVSPFSVPYRRAWIGFRFDPNQGWYPLRGDVNGTGYEDMIQITPYGDAWVSLRQHFLFSEPSRWAWLGFTYNENPDDFGSLPLCGDVNDDGLDDLIQITPYGDVWVALSSGNSFSEPERWAWLGFFFSYPSSDNWGAVPLSGDVNGDGKCDLVQITQIGEVWVSLSLGNTFGVTSKWGSDFLYYSPQTGYTVMCGDYNGDGMDDLVQISPQGEIQTALSNGNGFDPLSYWGEGPIFYDDFDTYLPLQGDVNSDGMIDLIQITPEGCAYIFISNGNDFNPPQDWGCFNFIYSREGNSLPMYLNY